MITSPPKPATTVTISRASDYTLTWTGGTSGRVDVGASSAGNNTAYVFCDFEASAGTGTIPAALLSMLPAGQGGIGITGWASTSKQVSDWGLYFSLFYDSLWPDGTLAAIGVTFN